MPKEEAIEVVLEAASSSNLSARAGEPMSLSGQLSETMFAGGRRPSTRLTFRS